jgi:hypothetical protein
MVATCYPFLPGRYDPLAAPLSAMAQVFGKAGLLLVPLGVWSALAGRRRPGVTAGRGPRNAAVAGVAVIWLLVVLMATLTSGFALGVITLVGGIVAGSLASRRSGAAVGSGARPAPAVCLLVVPPLVVVLQWLVVDRAGGLQPRPRDPQQRAARRGHRTIPGGAR